MTGNEYQELATRTNDGNHSIRLLNIAYSDVVSNCNIPEAINACLGLSGETGELLDMVKKWIFHEKELDMDHAQKELGDVMWYVAMFCHAMGWKLDDILKKNIEKLKARYPQGFDVQLSANRKEGDL